MPKSPPMVVLRDEALESLGFLVVVEFFDNLVVFELALCRLE